MKKVLCPGCGLMNLEQFITFPHCAGCGARLPEVPVRPLFEFWRRPIGAPMWATIIGLCCAALGVFAIAIARETSHTQEERLVVYAQMSRQMALGQPNAVALMLDTTEADAHLNVREFQNVRLRLKRAVFRDFELLTVSPRPQSISSSGSGRYFIFNRIQRDQSIQLMLRPRTVGNKELALAFYVRDFTPFEFRGKIAVTIPMNQLQPQAVASVPLRGAPFKLPQPFPKENYVQR